MILVAKSIKLPNGYYWDSSSVSHNREELNQVINAIGKTIRLKKTSRQNFSANNLFEVSWQEVSFDNTGGILAKSGNEIKCISGTHTVMVSAFLQVLNGSSAHNYIYIRHNGNEYVSTDLNNGNPHLTVPVVLEEGDTVSVGSYSSVAGDISDAYAWTGFCVTLLN